jgi:hypothetical protein
MAGTPAAEVAGRGATLSGDVVVRKAVEAGTYKLRQDGAVAFGNRSPQTSPVTMTLDNLESIGVDVGPPMGQPGRVRHRRPTSRSEALVHRDSGHRQCTQATLCGYSRSVQRRSPTTESVGRTGPAPMTPLPPCRRGMGFLHGDCALRCVRSPSWRWRCCPESLASSIQVWHAHGRRSEFVIRATRADVFLPTPEFIPDNRPTVGEEGGGMRGEGGRR